MQLPRSRIGFAIWVSGSLSSQAKLVPIRTCSALQQCRHNSNSANAAKYKKKDDSAGSKKKRKARTTFVQYDLRGAERFSLCDAMRYIRAFEVGRSRRSSKYELHVRLHTQKNGPSLRSRLSLPHPVNTTRRICVIAAPASNAADVARKSGAVIVGEETVFEAIKEGTVQFDRCICHVDSLQKLNQAGLGRILGPKGLMPSVKTGTAVKDVGALVREMVGGNEYRERLGVVRMAVGQLGFTPEEMQGNIKAFIEKLKKDIASLSDRIAKDIHEVVLSSTNAPGFSLNGEFRGPASAPTNELSTL